MTYPIDIEVLEHTGRLDEADRRFLREHVFPALNMAYFDGLVGDSSLFPLDVEKEFQLLAEDSGRPLEKLRRNKALLGFIRCMNIAYSRGLQDGKGESV